MPYSPFHNWGTGTSDKPWILNHNGDFMMAIVKTNGIVKTPVFWIIRSRQFSLRTRFIEYQGHLDCCINNSLRCTQGYGAAHAPI